MAHHADAEAPGQAPSYSVAADYFLWYARGSTDFIPLGIHREPPSPAMQTFIEYRQLPESTDVWTDTTEAKLLKVGFTVLEQLDKLGAPTVWPWP